MTSPTEVPVPIAVRGSKEGEETYSFEIDQLRDSYHPIEVHRCGVYATREFGGDPKRLGTLEIGQRAELWKYDYAGKRAKLILFYEKQEAFASYYSTDFRVDPHERYLSLVRGFLGEQEYALVIRGLNTLRDAFVLSITDIEKRNPDLVQDISFTGGGWTRDGRYFWADTHAGANTVAFIRIDMEKKTFDLFPSPPDVLGGDALNLERGITTVHPGNVWYGIADLEEADKAERKKQGIGTELYLQNLLTGGKTFVASTTEPLYFYQPRWLSDTVLQYTVPSGATSTYVLSN